MLNSVNNQTPTSHAFLSENAQAKAAKFKELTGKEILIEKNENGEIIPFWHPESTQSAGFFVEFFRVGFNSPDGFEASIENLARKYAELREDLLERYSDNQDELYKQLGKLNQAFESALRSTTLLPMPTSPSGNITSSNMPQSVRNAAEQEWQEYENIKDFMRTLQQNMERHLDSFFEKFIKNIQAADFDSAFTSTMDSLNASDSQSLSDVSFRDTALIRDTLMQGRYEEEVRDGETVSVFIFNKPINSLRQLVADTNVSEIIRRELAGLFGFNIPTPTEADSSQSVNPATQHNAVSAIERYTEMLLQGMTTGTGNGNPNLTGTPIQILNAKLFNISIAFGEISNQPGTNTAALQNAFRNLTLSLFDDAAQAANSNIEDENELEQVRAEARTTANIFLNTFFTSLRTITAQSLQDTRMARSELAFHESWNFIAFVTGTASVGGSAVVAGEGIPLGSDGQPVTYMSDEEFRRRTIEMLMQVARDNAEVFRQWAEVQAEEAERWRKVMLIAARIASGDNVPPQDREFLLTVSPGMYMLAVASQAHNDNPNDYESVLSDDEGDSNASQSNGSSGLGGSSLSNSGSTSSVASGMVSV